MRVTRSSVILILTTALVVGVVINCTGTMSSPGELEGYGPASQVAPACDPDGVAPCPEDFFLCVEDDAGNKHCEGQRPAVPGQGTWDCYEEGTTLVCRGDQLPADDGFWDCEQVGESVICRGHAYVPVSEGGSEEVWNCWYEGEFRVCESGEGSPSQEPPAETPPDEGDDNNPWDNWFPDNDGNGIPDEFEDMAWDWFDDFFDDLFNPGEPGDEPGDQTDDCLCVPGAWRYCDTPTYCRWGVQTCEPDGLRWGGCVEAAPPSACSGIDGWYSPDAEACCVEQGFCCQDMWDLDLDGDTWESLGGCSDVTCG